MEIEQRLKFEPMSITFYQHKTCDRTLTVLCGFGTFLRFSFNFFYVYALTLVFPQVLTIYST